MREPLAILSLHDARWQSKVSVPPAAGNRWTFPHTESSLFDDLNSTCMIHNIPTIALLTARDLLENAETQLKVVLQGRRNWDQ